MKINSNQMLRLTFASLLVTTAIFLSGSRASGTQIPDLSGKWRINTELSDDVKQKLANALPPLATAGRTGNKAAQNQEPRDREREETRRRIEALIEASAILEITQTSAEVTVAEGNLRERKFYTDGRPSPSQDRRGNLSTIRAHWRGDRLVVDTKLADGGRLTETYELGSEGRQLILTVTSQDRRLKQALVIRRVYDAQLTAAD